MKNTRELLTSTLVTGLFVVVPVYLAVLLLLKGMKSAATLVRPVAMLLPGWIPAEGLCSLLLVLFLCFLVGAAVRTPELLPLLQLEKIAPHRLARDVQALLDVEHRDRPMRVHQLQDLILPLLSEHVISGNPIRGSSDQCGNLWRW